jgi:murein DD-endopeptidase MepM/ murein hydrolase activator NlpD
MRTHSNHPHSRTSRIAGITLTIVFAVSGVVASTPVPFSRPHIASAQTASADELRQQIGDTNDRIAALEREINALATNLDSTSKQAQTLKSALATLELSRKKLEKDLSLTTSKIKKTSLTLTQLGEEIAVTKLGIRKSSAALAQGMRDIQAADAQSTIMQILGKQTLSDTWGYVESLRSIHAGVIANMSDLREMQSTLDGQKSSVEKEKATLVTLQKNLSGQKQVVEYSKVEQSKLLTSTQNSAAAYQAQLAEKKRQKEQFESELFDYESKLKVAIDPASVPSARAGLFVWPLDKVRITQSFGVTVDSVKLYRSGTHNGVDFAAAVGTPVKAVLAGTIEATGNTDLQKGCYSYGKWVLIKHPNGLSSLYAHLSVIGVNEGDIVATGDRIGYSGVTGYATGPHLHLTVLASQGVQVQRYSSSINCKNTTIPLANVKAYLNPLSYLPSL